MGTYELVWPTLTLIIGAAAWFFGTGLRRGSLLSPYSLVLLILISIFGIRPLLMPGVPESFDLYGHNVSRGFNLAALIGFLGTMSFIAGYALRRLLPAKRLGHSARKAVRPMVTPGRAISVGWALLGLWLMLMIVLGGGTAFLTILFAGRSEEANSAFAGVPAIVPALPVLSCLLAASVRFRWERLYRYTRAQNLAYWLLALAAVIPPSALGARRFLIPSVVIMVMGALPRTWHRTVKLRWLIGGFAAFVVLAIVPFVRSAGSRVGGETDLIGAMGVYFEEEGLRGTLNNFFLSYDTEMFNYVAYFAPRLGESIPYGMGRGTAGEVLTMAIPSALSPFERWGDTLLVYAFGSGCGGGGVCPVPSIVGVLFTDLSWAGLIFGMLALGYLAGNFERALSRSNGSYTALLLLVAGFSVLFARGNSLAQVWIAVQIFVAWWLIYQLVGTFAPGRIAKPRKTHYYAPPNRESIARHPRSHDDTAQTVPVPVVQRRASAPDPNSAHG